MYLHTTDIHNKRAAEIILPLVLPGYSVGSILDVGCGLGTWLSVARDMGIDDVLGVEGECIDPSMLAIPSNLLLRRDLTAPLSLGRRFDLAICLEVAEHLPPACADMLVESLVAHSDVILFSAAIPRQGGQDHVNEQWPEYWAAKFARHGFGLTDPIRPQVWENTAVDWWYRQNLLVAEKGAALDPRAVQRVVHPEMLETAVRTLQGQASALLNGDVGMKVAFATLLNAAGRRLRPGRS